MNLFNNIERKKIGTISIDSAQFIIMDPIYRDKWREAEDASILGLRVFEDVSKSKAKEIAKERGYSISEKTDEYMIETNGAAGIHEIKELKAELFKQAETEGKSIVTETVTDSTYSQIYKITTGKEQAGSVAFPFGGDGFMVAANTGADGRYDVYATFADVPDWGRKIINVEVDFGLKTTPDPDILGAVNIIKAMADDLYDMEDEEYANKLYKAIGLLFGKEEKEDEKTLEEVN